MKKEGREGWTDGDGWGKGGRAGERERGEEGGQGDVPVFTHSSST